MSGRIRRFKQDGCVLEYDGRVMEVREAGRRKRYPVSLLAIYHQAVRRAVEAERIAKKKAKKKS
jgi:predicted amidohydrolase YtcJ